jgi:uncharacterized damage-inducible protein DinB
MTPATQVTFERRWRFARGLTLSLLEVLNDADMNFAPVSGLGPLGRQFRHLGRIQCNYISALRTRRIEFGAPHLEAAEGTVAALTSYLQQADDELWTEINRLDWGATVEWFGESVDVDEHLHRMTEHETLHHGQLIVYMMGLGRAFPTPWSHYGL